MGNKIWITEPFIENMTAWMLPFAATSSRQLNFTFQFVAETFKGFCFVFARDEIWHGWAVSKVLWKWSPNVVSKAVKSAKAMGLAFVLLDFQYAGGRKRA